MGKSGGGVVNGVATPLTTGAPTEHTGIT